MLLFASALAALALAFPPFSLGFFACWALIPFLLLVEGKNAGSAFRWGYGAGLLANVATLHASFLIPSYDRLIAVLATPLVYGLLAVILAGLSKPWPSGYLIAAPFLWTIMEFVQARLSQGAAGLPLGYTQEYYAGLMRHSFSDSIFLVSFWVAAINVILLLLWRHREQGHWLAGLSALLLLFFLLPYAFSKFAWRDFKIFHETILQVRHAPIIKSCLFAAGGRGAPQELFVTLGF